MNVKLQTKVVGKSFATAGQVVAASNGRVLYTGRARPYGFTISALNDARAWAQERRHVIIGG